MPRCHRALRILSNVVILIGALLARTQANTAAPATPAPACFAWTIEAVDAPRLFSSGVKRLQLDSSGHPQMAYGGDALYYAGYDGSAWHSEVVDNSPNAGSRAALVLDSQGHAHISYCQGDPYQIKYAYWDGASWAIQIVDSSDYVSTMDSALALDSAGHPCIAYILGAALRLARWDGTAWGITTVADDAGNQRLSLALGAQDQVHISYTDSEGAIRYAFGSGTAWQFDTLAKGDASLALDGNGTPHLSFASGQTISLATRRASGWTVETVGSGIDVSGNPALAYDAQNRPHLAYYDIWNSEFVHTYRTISGWVREVMFSDDWQSPTHCSEVALSIDAAGLPHVSFMDVGRLIYLHREDGAYLKHLVDRSAAAGGSASLALDSSGRPHIGYVYDDNLAYAHRGTAWSLERLLPTEMQWGTGDRLALALTSGGQPLIAYTGMDGLHLLRSTAGGWHDETIPGTARAATPALAVDAGGNLWVAYYDEGSSTLRLARATTSGWTVSTVAPIGSGGISLRLNSAQQPCVSYPELESRVLRYARWNGSQWLTATVDGNANTGSGSSLALDADGNPHISYTAPGHDGLRYAHWSNGQWITETVDGGNLIAWGSSLALDTEGRPHIGYYGHDKVGVLRYAFWNGSAWVLQTLESDSRYYAASLALDAAGRAHVAIYDGVRQDLRYALGTPEEAEPTPTATVTPTSSPSVTPTAVPTSSPTATPAPIATATGTPAPGPGSASLHLPLVLRR